MLKAARVLRLLMASVLLECSRLHCERCSRRVKSTSSAKSSFREPKLLETSRQRQGRAQIYQAPRLWICSDAPSPRYTQCAMMQLPWNSCELCCPAGGYG